MRRVSFLAILVGIALALVGTGGEPSSAVAAKKKCGKAKVTRVINGKRLCVPAARFRQRAKPPPSLGESAVRQVVGGGPITVRLKNGTRPRPPRPKALVNAISTKYAVAELRLRTSLQEALTSTANARSHEIGFTGGTVTRSADGSSARGTIGFGGVAAGSVVSGTLEIGANASGKMDIGFDLTVTDKTGASKSSGITGRDLLKREQECPGSDGRVTIDGGHDVSTRSSETFGSKRVRLGGVREATTSTARSRAAVGFGPDGKAQPFAVTVSATYDRSFSGTALAFFGARTRAVGSGTLTGTLDPATGKISGATVTTKVRTSGMSQGQAAADAEMRALMEKMLNDELGRVLEKVRNAEKNCGGPYEVTLAVRTDSNFATHSASGTLNAGLTATKSGPGTFSGTTPVAYANVNFSSKTDCSYTNTVIVPSTFRATITVMPTGSLKVTWIAGDGSAGLSTSASVQCPEAPPIPGQVGPQLMQPAPTDFELPLSGGEKRIGGGFQSGGDGWTHDGTITVKRATR